jgi:Zn-dependent M28 family amino/carboxypeptidase
MKINITKILVLAVVLCSLGCEAATQDGTPPPTSIETLISQVSESEILKMATDLQNFVTRRVGYQGNTDAATFIFNKLSERSKLNVVYQGGSTRNVIATLPGTDAASHKVYIVGAHYDSTSDTPATAPGATDNACGVGIVLELARIMSQYSFKHDVMFAAWNQEETGVTGSPVFVNEALQNTTDIPFYLNYDSAGYDPEGRLILDIMYDGNSSTFAETMRQRNSQYRIGFTTTNNAHTCWSDHRSFWARGIPAIMTHSEGHGPAHTVNDTVDKISLPYAKKNGQLGLAVLAELAELVR